MSGFICPSSSTRKQTYGESISVTVHQAPLVRCHPNKGGTNLLLVIGKKFLGWFSGVSLYNINVREFCFRALRSAAIIIRQYFSGLLFSLVNLLRRGTNLYFPSKLHLI